MKKTIITVFLILAALVLALLVWELFFTDTGILHQAYNAVADGVNAVFINFTGESKGGASNGQLLPHWGTSPGEYNDETKGEETDTFEINN